MHADDATRAIAALDEPLRRQIYQYVRSRREGVTRDEVAAQVGISRNLAAFHLDKLADRGLLTFDFARPHSRGGPGAGRPAKRYRAADAEFEVSVPARRYQLAADLLAQAVKAETAERPAALVAADLARERGQEMGRAKRRALRLRPPGPDRSLSVTAEVLRENGYEPYTAAPGRTELANCPFDGVVDQSPDLMCGLNRALVEGVIEGIGGRGVRAVLDPDPSRCCVRLELDTGGRPRSAAAGRRAR